MKKIFAASATWWQSAKQCDLVVENYRTLSEVVNSVQDVQTTSQDCLYDISSSHQVLLSHDSIKLALEKLSDTNSGRIGVFNLTLWHSVSKENLHEALKGANDMEINVAFLWAAFSGRSDLFEGFLNLGVQLSFSEPTFGLTALHLTVYSNCESGTEYLVSQKGCYINSTSDRYTPLHCAAFGNSAKAAAVLLDKGADVTVVTRNSEGILHCAVRANAVECIRLFCDRGAPINQLDNSGRTPTHLAAELDLINCLETLLRTKRANVDQQTSEKKQTALHLAGKNRHFRCVDVLLDYGAIPNITDYKYRTPLHLAAKSGCNNSVEQLLEKGKVDPNALDIDKRTPLHLAVQAQAGFGNPCEVVRTLIRYGAAINAKDHESFTPLHLAAHNELSKCVEILILSNAVTTKSKAGTTALRTICQKTPTAVDALRKTLDQSIVFTDDKDGELRIDFGAVLRHCHRNEMVFLSTLVEEGQKDLLLHPLCRSFLYLKWKKIRKFIIFRAFWLFVLVAVMSSYVLLALGKHCYNFSRNVTLATREVDEDLCLNYTLIGYFLMEHPYLMEIEWYVMVIIAVGMALRKLCTIPGYLSFTHYASTIENVLDWSTIATVFLVSFVYTGRTYIWQNHVCAFGIMLGWINLMYILANFPFFGTYIAMYSLVQREFARLFVVFACLLIGFTVSFCILFPRSVPFSNIFIGFIATIVMAIGDTNFDLISRPSEEDATVMLEGTMQVFYVAFIICVSVILLNLLVGIVVNDIKTLKSNATLMKLVKMTKMIYCIEESLLTDYFHKAVLVEWFQWGTSLSSNGNCVLKLKMGDQKYGDLPKGIIRAAYEVARSHKNKMKQQRNTTNRDAASLASFKNNLENLKNEILNVKKVLEDNQSLMEQILLGIGIKVSNNGSF